MHLLLAMSPSNYLEHAQEAVRLHNEIGTRPNMTEVEKEASGITMDELHDRQIDDMNKRLDAEEADEAECEAPEGEGEESQDASSMNKESQMAGTDSQRSESQTAEPQAIASQATTTDSKFYLTGHLADDEPLPDIVTYKFDEWKDI
ncbi:hypothetical protein NW766_011990 [Fusarium irregulare]|uniref:Uncharacterized protein n=1 Tax=Fusarium irregulare TaxID=2494466 RepID=A0A9W8U5L5_9HYPO|nr:hypothetical protein NW766_011990 [Fusarium irregulare]